MSDPTSRAIGFAGLSAYRTDVDAAIAESDRAAAGPRPIRNDRPSPTTTMEPVHRDRFFLPGGIKKIGGWAIGIGIIVAIKAGLSGGPSTPTTYTPTTDTSPPVITVPPSAGDETTPAADQTDTANVGGNATSDGWSISRVDNATDASPAADPSSGDPSDMAKPAAYDSSTLSISELRYCLAEDIRLSAEQTALNEIQATDVERYNGNVDGINAAIRDYKSRCSQRSFMVSDKQIAEPQIEAQRYSLVREGRSRVE